MSCSTPNCNTPPPPLGPNPDISGIGVVLGFVLTAWGTLLALMFYYFLAPTKAQAKNVSRSLDLVIQEWGWKLLRRSPSPQWIPVFQSVILAMSDQQLVTGLAIIISGYLQLQCGLSFYHWQMITTLAWFSTITHLATLLFLQEYLQKHRWIWYIRTVLMTGLGLMLAIGILPSGASISTGISSEQSSDLVAILPRAAICLFDLSAFNLTEGSRQITMITSEILLLGGLCIRIVRMFSSTRNVSGTWIVDKPEELWRNALVWACRRLEPLPGWCQALFLPLTVSSLAILIALQCVRDFLASGICGVMWLLFSLLWGTLRLVAIRSLVDKRHRNVMEENLWGFGQLVSVLLLLIPILFLAEVYSELAFGKEDAPERRIRPPLGSVSESPCLSCQLPTCGTSDSPCHNDLASGPTSAHRDGNSSFISSLAALCRYDFRDQLWYHENLFLVLTVFTGAAIGTLPAAQWWGTPYSWNDLIQRLEASVASAFLICLICLCGIVDCLDPKEISQHRPMSLIRVVIDPGWSYRVARWVYIIVFLVVLPALPGFSYRVTIVWGACLFSLLFTLLACFYSVYSQLVILQV